MMQSGGVYRGFEVISRVRTDYGGQKLLLVVPCATCTEKVARCDAAVRAAEKSGRGFECEDCRSRRRVRQNKERRKAQKVSDL